MKQKIGVIGSGEVGQTLAAGFARHGHEVMIGSRDPSKLAAFVAGAGENVKAGTTPEAAAFGELVVVAVAGPGAVAAIQTAGAKNLAGKTVIDVTNPTSEDELVDGVITFFTKQGESLMGMLQKEAPDAHFVKAFNSVGLASMVNPDFGGVKPTMFICGDNEMAKAQVKEILDVFGWETEDCGSSRAAAAVEQLCIVWCIRGFRGGGWTHAYKLLTR